MKRARRIPILLAVFVITSAAVDVAGTPRPQEASFRAYLDMGNLIPAVAPEISICPVMKKDPLGRIWAVWEEWESDRSIIRIAQYQNGQISSSQIVSGAKEANFSPALSFDEKNSPWVIWVNYSSREYRLLVKDISTQKTWLLNSCTRATVTTPRLVFDRNNSAWAFWNETGEGSGWICYRIFNGRGWSPALIVPQKNNFACLNPDVAVDGRGGIWVAWSRYDGDDYELFLRQRAGNDWGEEIRITDNDSNDSFPAIALDGEGSPLISWTQSTIGGDQICVTSLKKGVPAEEVIISPAQSQTVIPRFIRDGENIGVAWRSEGETIIVPLTPHLFRPESALPFSQPSPQLIYNPSFDENTYVGFGDSITYGYIDRKPAPELGYPPRLDIILDQNFGPTQMINEGIGGETTVRGLERIDAVISARSARYFLIMEGTNDVITPDLSMETSAFNLREMTRKCLESGLLPVIATILPRKDWLGVKPYYSNRILSLNEKIREIPAGLLVPFVDMYEIFNNYPESDGGLLALLSNDRKHPSEKGYQVMAESWFDEIKNFPFPPVNIRLSERRSEQTSLRRQPFARPPRQLKKPVIRAGEPFGNVLAWQDNPKIYDRTRIQGYRIFRKPRSGSRDRFSFIAFVTGATRYIDPATNKSDQFVYVISAVRKDGVEGPCSEPVEK